MLPRFAWGFANALAAQAATTRLLYGMARDRQLPRFLARVDPHHQVPENATFVVAAVSLVVGTAASTRDDGITLMTTLVNFGALCSFLLLHVSVVNHFVRRQGSRNWLLHVASPLIGFGILAYVLWEAFPAAKTLGLIWLAIGIVVLLGLRAAGREVGLAGLGEEGSEAFHDLEREPRR